jgi:hypothetical protein
MGKVVEMPQRCEYLGCRKRAIRYDRGHTSIVHEGKRYHAECFDKMKGGPDGPTNGGEPAAQAARGFRKRMSAYENTKSA